PHRQRRGAGRAPRGRAVRHHRRGAAGGDGPPRRPRLHPQGGPPGEGGRRRRAGHDGAHPRRGNRRGPATGEGKNVTGEWEDEGGWTDLPELDEAGGEAPSQAPGGALPVVAVVGRPNVGKSTLVNRIIGRREAVVEDVSGVTRDRVTYEASWGGRDFTLVDTGGWEPDATGMAARIAEQARVAVVLADVIPFVVDATVGV